MNYLSNINTHLYKWLSKIYFLRKYSMKYAMEDFVRYEAIVNDRNSAKQNEVR